MDKMMEIDNEEELIEAIRQKIIAARKWAKKHFNSQDAGKNFQLIDENLNFTKPCFFIDFPDVDRMIIAPSVLGERSILEIEYRLYFEKDKVAWEPVYLKHLPKLWIE